MKNGMTGANQSIGPAREVAVSAPLHDRRAIPLIAIKLYLIATIELVHESRNFCG